MKKIILFVVLLSNITLSWAKESFCKSSVQTISETRIQTGQFRRGDCYITITPSYIKEMRYRSFIITDLGQILVFNSFGWGTPARSTGARAFHTLPKRQNASWKVIDDKLMEITLVNGKVLAIDLLSSQPIDNADYRFEIDPDILPTNNGGVEIIEFKDIILDSGYKIGGSPIGRIDRQSILFDSYGNRCDVENKEVFKEIADDEIVMKFANENDFTKFTSVRCPQLRIL